MSPPLAPRSPSHGSPIRPAKPVLQSLGWRTGANWSGSRRPGRCYGWCFSSPIRRGLEERAGGAGKSVFGVLRGPSAPINKGKGVGRRGDRDEVIQTRWPDLIPCEALDCQAADIAQAMARDWLSNDAVSRRRAARHDPSLVRLRPSSIWPEPRHANGERRAGAHLDEPRSWTASSPRLRLRSSAYDLTSSASKTPRRRGPQAKNTSAPSLK